MLIRYHSSDDVAGNNLTFTAKNVSKGGQLALGENVDHRAGRAKWIEPRPTHLIDTLELDSTSFRHDRLFLSWFGDPK
jgi:hypothetical protein